MLAFLDESGDTGMKGRVGSSKLFTVAIVYFPDRDEATAVDNRISLLRHELGVRDGFEFHFSEICDNYRSAFFDAVSPYNFYYFGFVANKEHLYGPGFQYKSSFYKWVCRTLIENAKPYLNEAILKIDKTGNMDFRNEFCSYLKRRINDPKAEFKHIKKVRMECSSSNNLLQLADMTCGAIARSYRTDRPNPEAYRRKIAHLEIEVRLWPAK